MKAVLKIGGSLMNYPDDLSSLLMTIEKLADRHRFLLVPGGGTFADNVLKIQQALVLSDNAAHWMAIMAQNLFGIALVDGLVSKNVISEVDEFTKSSAAGLFVLMPFAYLKEKDELPHTWDVTSDSIALWIGEKTCADVVLLVKSIDGIVNPSQEKEVLSTVDANDLHLLDINNVVDAYLSQLVPKFTGRLYVVNGIHPERIGHIISGQATICTEII